MKQTLRQLGLYAGLINLVLIGPQPTRSQSLPLASQSRPSVPTNSTSPAVRKLKTVLSELKNRYQVEILFEDKVIEGYVVPTNSLLTTGTFETLLERILEPFNLRYKRVKVGTYLIMARKD